MSHYATCAVKLRDADLLVAMLGDLYGAEHVRASARIHESGAVNDLTITGYSGAAKGQIVIEARNCGGHFGGMAFVRRADNSFGLVVDNMDGRRLAEHLGWPAGTHEQFAQRFAQEFALRTVQTKMAEQGYTLDVQRADDGTLKITASSAVSSYGTNPSSGGYSL